VNTARTAIFRDRKRITWRFFRAAAAGALWIAAASAPARAEVIYELLPALGVGVTDNANVQATATGGAKQGDTFVNGSTAVRLRYVAARSGHALGYRFSYTHFVLQHGIDTLTNELTEQSTFTLAATLELRVGAAVALSRNSGTDLGDVSARQPQAMLSGTSLFAATTAFEEASYQPSGRRRHSEALRVGRVDYLEAPTAGLPTSTALLADLRTTWLYARDSLYITGQIGDTITSGASTATSPFDQGQSFYAQILGGWRRELSAAWVVEFQAGPLAVFKLAGPAVIAPAGSATVSYSRLPWFATVRISQMPAPNLFVGAATISDQALANLALPLNKRELMFVSGFGGYTFARIADSSGRLQKAFDQLSAGVNLTGHLPKAPFWGALQYAITDQRGGNGSDMRVPDLVRQTLVLYVGGAFAWGPGTAPLFGGGP
jgi:hypothetical protein